MSCINCSKPKIVIETPLAKALRLAKKISALDGKPQAVFVKDGAYTIECCECMIKDNVNLSKYGDIKAYVI